MSTVTGIEMTQKGHYVSPQVGLLVRGEQPKKGDIVVSDLDSVKALADRILIEPTAQNMVLMRTPHAVTGFGDRQTINSVIERLEAARNVVFPTMPFDLEEDFEVFLADNPTVSTGDVVKYLTDLVRRHPKIAAECLANLLRP